MVHKLKEENKMTGEEVAVTKFICGIVGDV